MSDIFISYASKDLIRIRPIVQALDQTGWEVFWDRTIPAGGTWRKVIGSEVDSCRCMVVIWSKNSIDAEFVCEEADEGKRRDVLVPILIDDVIPPMGFRNIQAASLVGWSGKGSFDAYDALLIDLTQILGKPPAGKAEEKEQPTVSKATHNSEKESASEGHASTDKITVEPGHQTKTASDQVTGLSSPKPQSSGFQFKYVVWALLIITLSVGMYLYFDYWNKAQALAQQELISDNLSSGVKGPKMVVIPSGSYEMGSSPGEEGESDETPRHPVSINSFAMGKYEVTFEEYDLFAEASGREKPTDQGWGRGKRPVINVSWHDAAAYAGWLSTQTGQQYRLPSEAEWEYAARAGTESAYWWGSKVGNNQANCDKCGSQWDGQKTAPVDSFTANPFGLHNTSGNVWEWVEDCYTENYDKAANDGSAFVVKNCSTRVLRGGSWGNRPQFLRSANRDWITPDGRGSVLGFRLARTL